MEGRLRDASSSRRLASGEV